MTIRNLNSLFRPASLAVIGHGKPPEARDARLVMNLLRGQFSGPIMPVNPDCQAVQGILAYGSVDELPLTPDLAVITTDQGKLPALIDRLGQRGTRAVLLLGEDLVAEDQRQAVLEAARPHLLRILGPNDLGLACPTLGLNATLTPTLPKPGHICLMTQSSAISRAVMDWATTRQIGFSHLISVGRKFDVDFADLLDYFTRDNQTRSILLYLESIRDGRKFMSAARAAARIKPVVVLKPRLLNEDPVEDAIYDAAFRRAGILRVKSIEHLFDAAEMLANSKPVYNNRLTILGNSRSIGQLAQDALLESGGRLAELTPQTREQLEGIAPQRRYTDNPVDLGDGVSAAAYGEALKVLLADGNSDAVLVIHSPTDAHGGLEHAQAVVEAAKDSRRLVLTSWVGSDLARPARELLEAQRMATYSNPGSAAQAFVRAAEYLKNRELLMETPASIPMEFSPDTVAARAMVDNALMAGHTRLNVMETQCLLDAYRIPLTASRFAPDPEEAARITADLGTSVALKVLSADIRKKSDVGGVAFNLGTAEEVLSAANRMLLQVQELAPGAHIDGFEVQPMMPRGGAYEITIGVRTGRRFGPVIFFGQGGTEAEVINDIAYALPPLNMQLARELMSRTRIYQMFTRSPARQANLDALALTLIKVSQMVTDLGEITSLDINPLWANSEGVVALDASVDIQPYEGKATDRFAIRPYPRELEEEIALPDGQNLRIRPILPEDEPPLRDMVRRMPERDLRLRFFQPIRELSHAMAARLTQLDYDREMAFVITEDGIPGQAPIWGVVRFNADPDLERAEYAITLDRAVTGKGMGPLLMRRIIDYARRRGIQEIYGEVLRENEPMLKLNRALGFQVRRDPDDPGVMIVTLKL